MLFERSYIKDGVSTLRLSIVSCGDNVQFKVVGATAPYPFMLAAEAQRLEEI